MTRALLPRAVALLGALALFAACEQIRPPGTAITPLGRDVMPADNRIPREFGRVFGASTSETYPGWGQLYFEDEEGTIRIVFVSFTDRALEPKVLAIPRGGAPPRPENPR
jgi:hypothetical protein